MQAIIRRLSSFTYLNATQFLGALNDQVYKFLCVYFLIQVQGIENSSTILSLTGAIFVLPFILLSAASGGVADRFSKRNIIIIAKVLELLIMCLGVASFVWKSEIGAYTVLFLMATQSVLFSPCKYGIIPELVSSENIARANGLMTSFTYLAIILGSFLASFFAEITGRNFVIAALFCVVIAIIGLVTSFCIEYTEPGGSKKKFPVRFVTEICRTLIRIKDQPSLLSAVFGSAYFLFIGSFVQLNIIPFAVQSLHLTDVQGGYLFLLVAVGIGLGALIAGKISGKTAELGLVPIASLLVTISMYLLDFLSGSFIACVFLVIISGIFAGLYLIPQDSFIQMAAPKELLGQTIAANNFLGFFGVLLSSGLLYLNSEVFGLTASQGFAVIGSLTLVVTLIKGYQFFDYVTRFIGMILSRLHFKTVTTGREVVPETPAVYVCPHTAWNDTLLMLGAQRRRMRFFIEHEQYHKKWLRRLYRRLLRVVFIPEVESLENNTACLDAIQTTLQKGISVCIFVNDTNIDEEFRKLERSPLVKSVLEQTKCPLISVAIEKGQKENTPPFFTRLFNKMRVPASLKFVSVAWECPSGANQVQLRLPRSEKRTKTISESRPLLKKLKQLLTEEGS